jgi:DNA N-6-adenine-methyltransferase Dam
MKKNDCLKTPEHIWRKLGVIDLDPCAAEETRIGLVNYAIERDEDGLILPWSGFVFCNPPFSQKEIWARKIADHGNGILILPERGSAPWFGPLAKQAGAYWVMGQKINFVGGPSSNNLGSVLFPFGAEAVFRLMNSGLPGHFVEVKQYRPRAA